MKVAQNYKLQDMTSWHGQNAKSDRRHSGSQYFQNIFCLPQGFIKLSVISDTVPWIKEYKKLGWKRKYFSVFFTYYLLFFFSARPILWLGKHNKATQKYCYYCVISSLAKTNIFKKETRLWCDWKDLHCLLKLKSRCSNR